MPKAVGPCRRWFGAALAVALMATAGVFTAPTASAGDAEESYAALGDSYASGLGTREYDDDACRRGPKAYPQLLGEQTGADVVSVACMSAEVPDVRENQLDVLDENTTHVTVQVGGNDAGFTEVMLACAQPWPTTCWGQIDEANATITDTLPGALDGLYDDIAAAAPNARVVVVGYPRLFNGQECNAGARISPGEQEELNATADLLSETIEGRANAHGFGYVDARPSFDGHSVCDDEEFINGLASPVEESYHPNQAGHRAYTEAVHGALFD